ncbi:hypothetical protein SAMN05428949_3742 [Chitinophaga sp. YR627]|uniref:hypothetical protein n=1 Tax=Chitinophaga sp. YR627 TaxID=1881041 RepID=UPI0008DF06CA|nr:hypothetical protein [Chitinophaga sp. YR627]SFN88434.1 hypothetical protein SAMN05428949_3742 [Chitinophaga sp. YR627]
MKSPKATLILHLFMLILSCSNSSKNKTEENINDQAMQDSLFINITKLTDQILSVSSSTDTSELLILPITQSCPYCRGKIIDQLVKHDYIIPSNRYLFISSEKGYKTVNSYFIDNGGRLPMNNKQIIVDSFSLCTKYNLADEKPIIYHMAGKKVYKKTTLIPHTIQHELNKFLTLKH